MTALTFDTLKINRDLKASGLTEKQAEAVTTAIKEAQNSNIEQLATKKDLSLVETKLEAKIDRVADRLLLRLGSLMIAIGGIILAYLELRT